MNAQKTGRLALITATTGFVVGVALLNGGSSDAIGGLCNGFPASHTWLDASGQYGPALLDGTDGDDVILGSDGDDTIDAGDGLDYVCGGPGDDDIFGGDGGDVLRGDTGDDDVSGGTGSDTLFGDGGNDTIAGGFDYDIQLGGDGDDVMIDIEKDRPHDELYAGDGFDVCIVTGGAEMQSNCEY
jgi:Ca2+-binding RTX toxin-like protein